MRRSLLSIAALVGLAVLVSACQITPVQFAGTPAPEPRCSQIRTRIAIDPPAGVVLNDAAELAGASEPADPLAKAIVDAYASGAEVPPPPGDATRANGRGPVSASMLFLSGGSQNGAFGAGYMDEWARLRSLAGKPGGLPRFRVVTGISTGALQSTFAFLGETDEIVRSYSIRTERELLRPYAKAPLSRGSGLQKAGAALAVVRRGALAELQPLRETLRTRIDDALLRRVAAEGGLDANDPDRRFLLVGAVEMDSGDAYVFDLTAAAKRYAAGDATMRDCYIEALMASSSVPMAALPVFIDGKMYIDGGARFGVISDRTAALFEMGARRMAPGEPKNLFVIVNGTLEAGTLCHLRDCADNPVPPTPDGEVPRHAKWRFDALAFRSLSILINQAYRSSVYWSTAEAKTRGFDPYIVRIRDDYAAHEAAVDLDGDATTKRPCSYWREQDIARASPLEFHPRFMRCLIDYGRHRGETAEWAALE